ncbi:exonuclease II [Flagelloscypha sp. PMI_526]|nr:exonuclease II [Flagelloscypha sp. PMI_526]
MGIPKFFRYISERYPLTSQLIQENKIPEFDNLYLDFNSIIHACSHPNDEDAHFRLSEEQIFTSIFTYVDHLFGKIKPKKLFFMAVDGVAPRAKMNQQRSRRFRTAKEAREVREKAERKGEKLPEEKAFDSNCITPGTPFMARLSEQLRYFVNKKITEDSNWRDIQVVLSGHEVPGEGEHKIMEYIRLSRAQPDYNPNVRHCLYGLDADLIMLGLLSHDPHFCLLREEVKFGPSSKKKNTTLESMNFYLLHLSLMREYLDLEFKEIEPTLPFTYSLERVIDDFILLAVFVGNDFLPNLPDLHIHENGLEKLFDIYKKVLPSLDGYVNENGTINTKRLQAILDEMAVWEQEIFEKEYADLNWYKGKQAKIVKEMELARKRNQLVLTAPQREIFDKVKNFVLAARVKSSSPATKLSMKNTFAARERKFITDLGEDLHLSVRWDEFDEDDDNLVTWALPGSEQDPPPVADEESEDEEANFAVDRVLHKYERAPVWDENEDGGFDARHDRAVKEKMDEWKRGYYQGKLEFSYDDPKSMGDLVYRYVEGLQWVMYYYYSGVAAWGWFYDYHYAPRISDLKGIEQMTFTFNLGRPFKPFEQLMGVMPSASKDLLPRAYHDLMLEPTSPIIDFYPLEFEQDLNGKKAEWEAIVKIPFIQEDRLLRAMASRDSQLTAEEKRRNSYGNTILFTFNPGEPTVYPSSLPGFFPPLQRCTCIMQTFNLPTLDGLHLVPGLCDGVLLGKEALAGFPSLKTLPHSTNLGHHAVNVHGQDSRNKSMVVTIQNPHDTKKSSQIAQEMIDKRTFTGWPFLQEGLVVAVSDSMFKYEQVNIGGVKKVVSSPHSPQGLGHWKNKAERIESVYSKKFGVITGIIEVLLHVRPLKGLRRLDDGALVKDYDPQTELEHAVQMTLDEVASEDPRFMEKPAPPLSEEFPEGSKIFFLGEHAYGVAAQVSATTESTLSVILAFFPSEKTENDHFKSLVQTSRSINYYPSFKVAERVGLSGLALSRITSSFMVLTSDNQKHNLGLSIKFDAKSLKVINYSKKDEKFWEFSDKAIELLKEYKDKYPEVFQALERSGDSMAKAEDVLGPERPDERVKEIKSWLKSKGVRDFEAVSLFCDQLPKETVTKIQQYADACTENKSSGTIKKAIVKGIPRQAVLKPAHAVYRLQTQRFGLGDRVTMVQDSGGVPLSVKGVVIGLNHKNMDVLWDVPFMSGSTLGDRCAQYRGSTVDFTSCLNLTEPQFIASTNPKAPPPPPNNRPVFKPQFGPRPAIQPTPGQQAASGFRAGPAPNHQPAVQIMANPRRGATSYRGGHVNGGGRNYINTGTQERQERDDNDNGPPPARGGSRGGYPFRGRGYTLGGSDRGGPPRGRGFQRGRGRGFAPPVPS